MKYLDVAHNVIFSTLLCICSAGRDSCSLWKNLARQTYFDEVQRSSNEWNDFCVMGKLSECWWSLNIIAAETFMSTNQKGQSVNASELIFYD